MRLLLAMLATLLLACGAAGQKANSVVISVKAASPGCKMVGNLRCSGWDRDELKDDLKARAASMGANYVQVESLSRNGQSFEAEGAAYTCQ